MAKKVTTPPPIHVTPDWKTKPVSELVGESYTRRIYFDWGVAAAMGARAHILNYMKPNQNTYTQYYREGFESANKLLKKEK